MIRHEICSYMKVETMIETPIVCLNSLHEKSSIGCLAIKIPFPVFEEVHRQEAAPRVCVVYCVSHFLCSIATVHVDFSQPSRILRGILCRRFGVRRHDHYILQYEGTGKSVCQSCW